jgi:hypothetical protein
MLGTEVNKSNFRNIQRGELAGIKIMRHYILEKSFFLNGCAFVHLRFNVFQIIFQQLHSN